VESCSRLGRPAVAVLGGLVGDVGKSGFVAAALWERSIGLCKGNYLMDRASLGVLAGVAGWGFRLGSDRPMGAL
jgi:hypothetical protein